MEEKMKIWEKWQKSNIFITCLQTASSFTDVSMADMAESALPSQLLGIRSRSWQRKGTINILCFRMTCKYQGSWESHAVSLRIMRADICWQLVCWRRQCWSEVPGDSGVGASCGPSLLAPGSDGGSVSCGPSPHAHAARGRSLGVLRRWCVRLFFCVDSWVRRHSLSGLFAVWRTAGLALVARSQWRFVKEVVLEMEHRF